jgi:L-amino acid N-acyltransferase YncA
MKLIDIAKKIKNDYPILWYFIELLNSFALSIYKSQMNAIEKRILSFPVGFGYRIQKEEKEQEYEIYDFFKSFTQEDIEYFRPFPFDHKSIKHVITNTSYQIFILKKNEEIVGLFFLRYFINKKCFLGFVVKRAYQGKGIGKSMLNAMTEAVKNSSFILMSTVCEKNKASLAAHLADNKFEIIDTLPSHEILLRARE